MPKYKKGTTNVSLSLVDDGQRIMVTIPKVWMDQLEYSADEFFLEGKLTKDTLDLEITSGKIFGSGTYYCPKCGEVDVFEGHFSRSVSTYDIGDEIPVACSNCGTEPTQLKDWSA